MIQKYQFSGHLSPRPPGTEQAMCQLGGEVYLASDVSEVLRELVGGAAVKAPILAEQITQHHACGRFVGDTQYWDIDGETISDAELRQWCWMNLPENCCYRSTAGGIVAFHTMAYALRRRAIYNAVNEAFRNG